MATFYLGTSHAHWLAELDVPLFVSRRTLAGRKRMPRARAAWAMDGGGFTELAMHGRWETPTIQFVAQARRIRDEVGNLAWAAPQDWMCEPAMLDRTGLTVPDHQRFTTANFLRLRELAPDVPWVPVLQGWTLDDYMRHADHYAQWGGVHLQDEPLVAVGSLCRRHRTLEAEAILRGLAGLGLRLHGFGLKLGGLRRAADVLASADSMAWSYRARHIPPMGECVGRHLHCNNCQLFALRWRQDLLSVLERDAAHQTALAI